MTNVTKLNTKQAKAEKLYKLIIEYGPEITYIAFKNMCIEDVWETQRIIHIITKEYIEKMEAEK